MKIKTILTCVLAFIGLSSIVAFAGTIGLGSGNSTLEPFWQQIQSVGGFGMFFGTLAVLVTVVSTRFSKSRDREFEFAVNSGRLYVWPLTRRSALCLSDTAGFLDAAGSSSQMKREETLAVFTKTGQLTGDFVRTLLRQFPNIKALDLQHLSVDYEQFEDWEEMVDLRLLVLPQSLNQRQFRRLAIELPDVTLLSGPLAIEILNYYPEFAEETDLIVAEFADDDKKDNVVKLADAG